MGRLKLGRLLLCRLLLLAKLCQEAALFRHFRGLGRTLCELRAELLILVPQLLQFVLGGLEKLQGLCGAAFKALALCISPRHEILKF